MREADWPNPAARCSGAGDVIGRRQSGRDAASALRVARLPADRDLLEAARAAAARALARYGPDPAAWPPALLAAMQSQARPASVLRVFLS